MPYIELSGKRGKGHRTLVDDDTYKKYGHLSWYLSDTGYALRKTKDGYIRLHRLVADTPEGLLTDHKNHDRLDNRASNLRIVTHKGNMGNLKGAKGYTWDESKRKWMVRYKRQFYGRYETEEQAREAYKRARSGVPYTPKVHPRRHYLPNGVHFMKPRAASGKSPYYIRPKNGDVREFHGYFSTPQEAEDALSKLLGKEK